MSDRAGRKPVLVAGWIVAVPVPLLLIWAPTWGWIVAANVLLGVNQGLTWSTTVIMKIDLAGPTGGLAMGLNEAAGYGAVAVTAVLTGWIAANYGLRPEPFLLGAAHIALGLGLSTLFVRETRSPRARRPRAIPRSRPGSTSARSSPAPRSPTATCLPSTRPAWSTTSTTAWPGACSPVLFAADGLSVGEIGVLAALYPAVWGAGQLVTGALSDRSGRKPLIVTGMLTQAAALALFATGSGPAPWALAAVALGAGTAMVYPTLLAAIGDVAHRLAGVRGRRLPPVAATAATRSGPSSPGSRPTSSAARRRRRRRCPHPRQRVARRPNPHRDPPVAMTSCPHCDDGVENAPAHVRRERAPCRPRGRAEDPRQRLRGQRLRNPRRGRRARRHPRPRPRPAAARRGRRQGWPGLYLARQTGCDVVLTDVPLEGPAAARRRAASDGTSSPGLGPGGPRRGAAPSAGQCRRRGPHRRAVLPRPQARRAPGHPPGTAPRGTHRVHGHLPYPGPAARPGTTGHRGRPPHCRLRTSYAALLRSAGFVDIAEHDLTPAYLATARTKLAVADELADGMADMLGRQEFDEMQAKRRRGEAPSPTAPAPGPPRRPQARPVNPTRPG